VVVAEGVAAALRDGRPVVALESTLIAHGLPHPDNLGAARRIEAAVREAGAEPATIAVVDGTVRVGLDEDALAVVAGGGMAKAGARELPLAVARGASAATTVSATAHLAARAGIRVFATGGLGGVHRGASASFDESADLVALARTRVCVVCSGVKSLLDVPATLERLETLGVPVVAFGTDRLPGFFLRDAGAAAPARVDRPEGVAAMLRAAAQLGLDDRAVVVARPIDEELDRELHDRVVTEALAAAEGVRGADVTPQVLARIHAESGGASLRANVALVEGNARLAARIAALL
jgi:pseudouridine-5'-phosphate glycosidase